MLSSFEELPMLLTNMSKNSHLNIMRVANRFGLASIVGFIILLPLLWLGLYNLVWVLLTFPCCFAGIFYGLWLGILSRRRRDARK